MRTVIFIGTILIASAINPDAFNVLSEHAVKVLLDITAIAALMDIVEFVLNLVRKT